MSKRSNAHAQLAGELLEKMPKTVWAAIAVAAVVKLHKLEAAPPEIVQMALSNEWDALYHAGVVPQKPPGTTTRRKP